MKEAVRSFPEKSFASKQAAPAPSQFLLWKSAKVVFGFNSLPGEPDWMGGDLPPEKIFAYPRAGDDGMLVFLLASEFQTGALGIREPVGATMAPSPDLVLVPGLAFDTTGARLGQRQRILRPMAGGEPDGARSGDLLQMSDSGKSSFRSPRRAGERDRERGGSPCALRRWYSVASGRRRRSAFSSPIFASATARRRRIREAMASESASCQRNAGKALRRSSSKPRSRTRSPSAKEFFSGQTARESFESIHPWSKTVKRERAQEPSLGSGAMGDEPAIVQEVVDPRARARASAVRRQDPLRECRGPFALPR